MQNFGFFLGLTIFTFVASSTLNIEHDLCEIERLFLIRQHDNCVPEGYSLVNILEQFQRTAFLQTSKYAMQRYVKEFCTKTENATDCYNLISVTDRCRESSVVINEINTLKFVETALKFMCEDEGSRFVDLLSDDGPRCYAINNEHTDCIDNEMGKLNLDAEMFENVFIDHNTCRFIQAAKYCLYTYDRCVNRHVKYHMSELNKVLNNEYQC